MEQHTEAELKSRALQQWRLMYIHGCGKSEALRLMGVPENEIPKSSCYACECSHLRRNQACENATPDYPEICSYCPVDWGNKAQGNFCSGAGSPFDEWLEVCSSREEKLCAYEVHQTILNTWEAREE